MWQDNVRLAPSIAAADFARLGEQVLEAEHSGADRIHIDIMDGHFVPTISVGPAVVRSIRRVASLPLEVHLQVADADFFLEQFAEAGADSFVVHVEGNSRLRRTIQRIRSMGKRAGVAINPATSADVLAKILPELDQVLVMTINPGDTRRKFIEAILPKIWLVRQMIEDRRPACELAVEGGIDRENAFLAADAGAGVLVAGASVFGCPDGIGPGMRALLEAARRESRGNCSGRPFTM
jgi:ribulose-phosphate 3-epimerase